MSLRLVNFGLEHALINVQVGLKLNGVHQLLASFDGVNQLEDNIDTTRKNHRDFNCC
jgi:hypothetical protein